MSTDNRATALRWMHINKIAMNVECGFYPWLSVLIRGSMFFQK
jgi:hypothetical protein